jgi:hypothetical protein
MPDPHSDEQIKELEIFELLALAIPRGKAKLIGPMIGVSEQTVRMWRNDPNGDENREVDPNGRRSPLDHILQFLAALYAQDPNGARLVKRRIDLEFAEMEAIHGHDELLEALEVAGRARSLAQEIIALTDPTTRGNT